MTTTRKMDLKQKLSYLFSTLHCLRNRNILDNYVTIPGDVILHKLPIGGLICKKTSGKFNKPICYAVNKTAMKIFEIISRERCLPVKEVILKLFEEFQEEPSRELIESIVKFIKEATDLGHLVLLEKPSTSYGFSRTTGSEVMTIPFEIVIELTYKCNLRCIHCYAEAGVDRKEIMPTDKVCYLLDTFSDLGTRIVEFTGGEPLLHPDIDKILEKALRLFDLVSVLTNGTLITDRIIDIARKFRDKILFSITVYSYRPDVHDTITGVKGSFSKTIENIKLLVDERIPVRASVVITHINSEDVYKTIEFLYNIGVKTITYSPTLPIGRGSSLEQYLNKLDMKTLSKQIENAVRDFGDRLQILPEEVLKFVIEHGCGTGWRTLIIDPLGNVKLCIFGGPVFGNVFNDGIYEVLKKTSKMYTIPPPSEKTCGKCEYLNFCKGCYFRPYIVSQKVGRKCPYLERLERSIGIS